MPDDVHHFARAAEVRAALDDVQRFAGSFMETGALPAADEVLRSAEPFVRATAARLVEDAVALSAGGKPVDLVAAVADPLPSAVTAHAPGFPVVGLSDAHATEAARDLIGNCLHTLASWPELYTTLRNDRGLLPVVVEESLRLDTPVRLLGRETLAPAEVGGRPLAPGDRIVLDLAAANRDREVYDDPDTLRLDRARPHDHLAFGAGPHACPGAALARTQALAVLAELCDQVLELRLVDDFVPDPSPVFWANGHRTLPCVLTPWEA
ncbi:cytochrome P450 [Yinghuangia seranimata]|uniref:cytochrome P450 n=1 Tax=Yinghuangia seranimata TaxID=408067 RepID=UPI00248B7712|nr:cytochrome P450 [Yinghuangia seranimata]MDI2129366.1 cytochrome P450 [Yinghuangia seranimata]